MTSKGKGRLYRREDGRYILYLPAAVCEDSAFPFPIPMENREAMDVTVRFEVGFDKLIVEKKKNES